MVGRMLLLPRRETVSVKFHAFLVGPAGSEVILTIDGSNYTIAVSWDTDASSGDNIVQHASLDDVAFTSSAAIDLSALGSEVLVDVSVKSGTSGTAANLYSLQAEIVRS